MSADERRPRPRPLIRGSSVRVSIVGEEYTLRSEADEAHTREVAAHVDRVIGEVLATGSVIERHKAAILAALQIADELLRARADVAALAARADALAADVRRWLPPSKRADVEP